ncbi:hypothetical protein AB0K00_51870 [Dactylosporangium sp. NPDC049525]|uniref:hypothetical protein n=1 Tax=Dactylosporangium sp. NPDC049525 TaxID=3154730 RepID=UPI00342FEF8B
MRPLPNETWARSYRYVRIAMVALLIGLGVSVIYQTGQQGWHLLSSVSAYYYTPAQSLFVGSLIGLGACMIALRGTTDLEDVLLNLGGMFAAVVAIVPTSRDNDFRTAVRLCGVATDKLPDGVDCLSVRALEAAARANVENNMFALLVLGGLGILATVVIVVRERPSGRHGRSTWLGILVAILVYAAALGVFVGAEDRFIDTAHYVAAFGLFGCILAVVFINARRHQQERPPVDGQAPTTLPRNRYSVIALVMIGATVLLLVLWLTGVFTLFWLEIIVAGLFAVFWTVQTFEQIPAETAAPPPAD